MKYFSVMTFVLVITLGTSIAGNSYSETAMNDNESFGSNHLYSADTHPEEFCLAQNIYYESRTDNLAGQAAVADVVLNRVYDTRYPNTICEVVKQGPISKWWKEEKDKEVPIKNKCQFSWYCDGKPDDNPTGDKWRQAQELAYKMYHQDYLRGISEGSTHYHATYVNPKWNRNMHLIGRIGLHIFYVSR
jgi:spore germination cell wall hydrolase CwlJ-like protein